MDETTLVALRQVAERARLLLCVARQPLREKLADALGALDPALIDYDAAQAAADAALAQADETVLEAWGGPQCGECQMDNLDWDANGEMVTCASCGEMYAIAARPAGCTCGNPDALDMIHREDAPCLPRPACNCGARPPRPLGNQHARSCPRYMGSASEAAPIPPAAENLDAKFQAEQDYLAMVGRGLGLHRAAYR